MAAASSSSFPPAASPLAHSLYHCPGLHGPGSGTDVRSQTFAAILSPDAETCISIPLFQRRYCWSTRQLRRFWDDIHSAASFKPHHVGKIIFGPAERLVCIDGQQRITSILLAVAAVREVVLSLVPQTIGDDAAAARAGEIVAYANRVLFVGGDTEAPATARLIPSLEDRAPFLAAARGAESPSATAIDAARQLLVAMASAKARCETVRESLRAAGLMINSLLGAAAYVHVQLKSLDNAQQVFLWLSESSLMSGLLIANATPGETLHSCDLLRNAVLAHWLVDGDAVQGAVLESVWLPVERRFDSPAAFDSALGRFAAHKSLSLSRESTGLSAELYRLRDQIRVASASPDWASAELYSALNTQWLCPGVGAAVAEGKSAQAGCAALMAELASFLEAEPQ
eukprot:Amastigsp_a1137_20.p3 type:complete len:399 gc:universal Amastigsp_a1137_20:68-1264(+)